MADTLVSAFFYLATSPPSCGCGEVGSAYNEHQPLKIKR